MACLAWAGNRNGWKSDNTVSIMNSLFSITYWVAEQPENGARLSCQVEIISVRQQNDVRTASTFLIECTKILGPRSLMFKQLNEQLFVQQCDMWPGFTVWICTVFFIVCLNRRTINGHFLSLEQQQSEEEKKNGTETYASVTYSYYIAH